MRLVYEAVSVKYAVQPPVTFLIKQYGNAIIVILKWRVRRSLAQRPAFFRIVQITEIGQGYVLGIPQRQASGMTVPRDARTDPSFPAIAKTFNEHQ